MRVAMYYHNNDVRIEQLPRPKIGPGELLFQMKAAGICGSDVLEWYRVKKAPKVLGHESTGEIVEVGSGVKQYKPGDRVFVSHHIPCNTCHYCLKDQHTACETLHTTNFDPGGFAEYIRVPKLNVDRGVFILPPEVSYEVGTFVEPLACVVRGQRLANFQAGQSALILGGGLSGLLHLLLAKAMGAGQIFVTDIQEYRLEKAKALGADGVIHATEDVPKMVRKMNDGRAIDFVVVCTGAPKAFEQALHSVDRGGVVLCFATTEPDVQLSVPLNEFWRNGITLMPSYGAAPKDLAIALELLRCHRVEVAPMITHRLPLEQAQDGFRLVAEAGECLKVVLLGE